MQDDAATPEQGTAEQTEDMSVYGALDQGDTDALKKLDKLFEPEEVTEQPVEEPEATQDEGEEPEGEELLEEGETEAQEAEDAEAELPSTLDELAEAYEQSPEDFTGEFKVPVKIDGVTSEVTLAEAIKGYQREQDYTQKTESLAQERRNHEAQVSQVQQAWQQRVQEAESLYQALNAQVEQGPSQEEMAILLRDDPQEYLRIKAQNEARADNLKQFRQALDAQTQQQMQETANNLQKYQNEQEQIVKARFGLDSPEKVSEFGNNVKSYLGEIGFNDQEIDGFLNNPLQPWDARQLAIIDEARQFRQMKKGKGQLTKKLKAKPPVQKPGAKRSKGQSRTDRVAAAKQRLKKTGSDSAALDVIDTFFPEGT